MARASRVSLVLLLALFPLVGPPTIRAADPTKFSEAARFREEFGLRSDLSYIVSIESDARYSDGEWGVRLTPDELDEMERRTTAESQLGALDRWGERRPSNFAGMYIDQRAGFVIDVAFTADSASMLSDLQALAPAGVPVRIRSVERTLSELEAVMDSVAQDAEFHRQLGVEVVFVATDIPENVVEIGLHPLGDAITAAFVRRYGKGIELFDTPAPAISACTGRFTCTPPPMRAGTALRKNNANYTCTAGFAAWKWIPGPDIDYIQMTAGHCGNTGQGFVHNGVAVGNMVAELFGQESTADGGYVTLNDSWAWPNVYYSTTGSTPIYSVQGQNGDFIGQSVCVSGISIGNSCGTILNDNARVQLSGVWLNKQRTASYAIDLVVFGDSGGPVRSANTAAGIQSGYVINPTRSVFSHIWEVESGLGIHVFTQ